MFRNIYKSTVSKIKIDNKLISETKELLKSSRVTKQKSFDKYRYAAVACCCILSLAIIVKVFNVQWNLQNQNSNEILSQQKQSENTEYSYNPQNSYSNPNIPESKTTNIPADFISTSYEDAIKNKSIAMYVPKYLPCKSNYSEVFHRVLDASNEVSVITNFGIQDENGIIKSEVQIFTGSINTHSADIIDDNGMKKDEFLKKLQTGKELNFIYNDIYVSVFSYGHEFSSDELIKVIKSLGIN